MLSPLLPHPTLFSEARPTMRPVFSILVPSHLIFVLLFKHIDMYSQCNVVAVRRMSCSTPFFFFSLCIFRSGANSNCQGQVQESFDKKAIGTVFFVETIVYVEHDGSAVGETPYATRST